MAKIIAVCKSKKKGTKKEAIADGILMEDYGLIGDAHADCSTHRQVSLLAIEPAISTPNRVKAIILSLTWASHLLLQHRTPICLGFGGHRMSTSPPLFGWI